MTGYSATTNISDADAAYNAIVDLLFQHQLRPGEKTSVITLSKRIGLGRTPIKEAITRLETEGILSVAGRSGTIVNDFTADQARLIFSLRSALEDFASDNVVKNITPKEILHLRQLVAQMGTLSLGNNNTGRSVAAFVRANVGFHRAIIAGAKNPYLDRMFAQVQVHQQILLYLQHSGFQRDAAFQRQREHEDILKAVEKRDAKKLRDLLRRHSDAALSSILEERGESKQKPNGRSVRRKR